jgi:7-carboxy-7-deazaguanine synthase
VSHHHVVVTGGEPMLFEAVSELCERLRGSGCHITIETAGTVYRDLPCDLMSISPKLANSLPPQDSGWSERHEKLRLDRGPLAKLMERYECQLKFVVTTPDDIKEIEDLVSQLPSIEPWRIMLMAEGTDRETLLERQRTLVQPCLDRGWRLTPRWHVDLFGNTRGT